MYKPVPRPRVLRGPAASPMLGGMDTLSGIGATPASSPASSEGLALLKKSQDLAKENAAQLLEASKYFLNAQNCSTLICADEAALLTLLGEQGRPTLRPFSPLISVRMTNYVQGAFELRMAALARRYTGGSMSLSQWHGAMVTEVEQHVTQQMMLGGGSPLRRAQGPLLTAAQRQRLGDIMSEQSAYLQRFADHAAFRAGQGRRSARAVPAARAPSP